MRLALGFLLAANAWSFTCGVQPPCYAVRPGLTVVLAEAIDSYYAPQRRLPPERRTPIRMRLLKLILGASPGNEFTLQWFAGSSVRAGEPIYIEESNSPLRTTACGQTGPVSRSTETRQKFFQELAAGKRREAYMRVGLWYAPNSAVRLFGTDGVLEGNTDARGLVEWHNLPPGQYTVHPARSGVTLDGRREPNPVIQLLPGACVQVLFDPK